MSTAQVVFKQLKDDFPSQDAKWVLNSDVRWSGLASVPLAKLDFSNKQQWNATQHTAKIAKFVKKIQAGSKKPVILAKVPDNPRLIILDGHHRVLASQKLNKPVPAYIAVITGPSEKAAMEMHASQRSGNSGPPVALSNELTFTPMTAVSSTVPHPFAKSPKPGLWHNTGMQLAPYIQNVAHALLRKGRAKTKSDAIRMAYGLVKKWSQGRANNGRNVHPDVQAAAGRNIAQMDAKRMTTHMKHHTNLSNSLTDTGVHPVPAAMRRVKKHLENQGVPKSKSLAQTVALFKQWQKSGQVPPVVQEAAGPLIQKLNKRKRNGPAGKFARNLRHGGQAGGDTGYSYKQASFSGSTHETLDFANKHHDGDGKFAANTKERERVIREFQESHNLPVSGIMDEDTKEALQAMNKAVNE